ncbi:MAG: class I SAM-dependent methyltransferase [Solirubrobacteraceae bacterium]
MSRATPEDDDASAGRIARYEVERPDVERHVPLHARRILDLGCCTGTLGAALKRRQDATVVGVEIDQECAAVARTRLDEVVASDIERFLEGPAPTQAPFDCLIAADVLEHLVDPWLALTRAVELLEPGATVVVSLPNVANYRAIWRVLRGGRWPRDDWGVFDRTHLRWFTLDDGLDLLQLAGVRPTLVEPRYWTRLGRFIPFQFVFRGLDLRRLAGVRPTVVEPRYWTRLGRFIPFQFVFRAIKDDAPSDGAPSPVWARGQRAG